ncbi:MAG: DUF1311 domain-containing protein [Bauldia sp.]|uniref:lysozyme inhibitor LprI family protein n=1 Tax=Bauldia sp. TaxID=2575872 RepID=UPI001D3B6996|nr:lysozyme inhibitor LprI family protein [Bauldia sp.]MCB1494826.1 DUF1311 domain-containing protein [Bauldia sp.]
MRFGRGLALAIAIVGLSSAAAIAAPSFDCSGVEAGSTEELICNDAGLAALDSEMARLYAKIESQTTAEDFATIKTMQRGWLKGRDEAWKANDPRQYVADAYKERIAVLSIQAGEVMAPDPVDYTCTGGDFDYLIATFYDTDPPVGVFTRPPGGEVPQFIATGWDDDGATHYNIGGLDFVERDGKAALIWAGTQMACTRSPG